MVKLAQAAARWKQTFPCLLVITLFFLAFFHPVIFSHKFLVTSDAFNYLYPLRTVVWNEVRHGRLPLWTEQIMSGYPLLSMAQIAIGYPLTWLYLLLPGYWAEQIYFLAPYLLAPAFTYAYLREVKRSRTGSLLGALAFSYGGFMISPLASYSGLAANAVMWLPLMLIAAERARTRAFVTSLLLATGAYAMSVLSGWAQGFVYTALIALAYATCTCLFSTNKDERLSYFSSRRWRPLMAMLLAIVLAAGLDAFQILETMQVQRLSIRKELTYELFAMGSYGFGSAVRSFFLPLHRVFEASAYVAPIVLVLAVFAIGVTLRKPRRDWRVFFWAALALFGFIFMLGQNTPLTALLYHIPPFNLFRGAARHAFEFTLAASVLSAYGWDSVANWANRSERESEVSRLAPEDRSFLNDDKRRSLYFGLCFLVLSLVAGVLWMRDIARVPVAYMEVFYYPPEFPESRYLIWKLSFSFLTMLAVWYLLRTNGTRVREALLIAVIASACFFEPAIMVSRWWWPTLKPASRFTAISPVTSLLQKYPAADNRVYTHVYPMVEEYADPPRLEPANLTMIHGLHNVAGNEPLILDRYSRALGDVYIDAVKTRPNYPSDPTLLTAKSHVLDLLNTRFLVSYPHLATEPIKSIERQGIKFHPRGIEVSVDPGKSVTLKGAAAAADTLALVTATAWSAEDIDGTEVARVRVVSSQGKVIERSLLLGRDTAEWAHERTNVREVVRHSLATVFSADAENQSDPEPAYKFITLLALSESLQVDRIEISNMSNKMVLLVSHATLFDSTNRFSMPLPHYDLEKWQPVYDRDGALVLRNQKALPRVWLVGEAEAVGNEEALARIRGEGKPFDPRRTALLEIEPRELAALPGGPITAAAFARIAAQENNRLVIETNADTASVLVVSEVNYPGWVATVDGASAPIHSADFLLRGVMLPAGAHRVEMHYAAPAARKGALISVVTLLIIGALFVYAKRRVLSVPPALAGGS
jgi:hypothetical protein